MKPTLRSLAGIAALAVFAGNAFAGELTNADLVRACASQTTVFNKNAEAVGRRLDSYCAGYLESALHALAVQDREPCSPRSPVAAEYLLSVYEAYVRDASISPDVSAAHTLRAAYLRAFSCAK